MPPSGVVTLLTGEARLWVEQTWAGLEAEFGLSAAARRFPLPHLSYHVADSYDAGPAADLVAAVGAITPAFTVSTGAPAVFPGAQPVVHLPVTPTPELLALHHELWQRLNGMAAGPNDYYRPGGWVPHITLAHEEIAAHKLEAVLAWLRERPGPAYLRIDNIAFISLAVSQL